MLRVSITINHQGSGCKWKTRLILSCRCFHLYSFQPVSCNIVDRVQSLQATVKKLAYWTLSTVCVDVLGPRPGVFSHYKKPNICIGLNTKTHCSVHHWWCICACCVHSGSSEWYQQRVPRCSWPRQTDHLSSLAHRRKLVHTLDLQTSLWYWCWSQD